MRKAIFFDRDGVINYRPVGDYVKSPAEFAFCPDIFDFLLHIKNLGYLAIVITNQQGVGKGKMTLAQLDEVHNYMQNKLLESICVCFDEIYYCTSLASTGDIRRKPNPGMLLEAIEKYNIDITQSYMIGDSESDVEAGRRAGVRTIFLSPSQVASPSEPDYQVKGLVEVKEMIK